jgi:hypothetical protein
MRFINNREVMTNSSLIIIFVSITIFTLWLLELNKMIIKMGRTINYLKEDLRIQSKLNQSLMYKIMTLAKINSEDK